MPKVQHEDDEHVVRALEIICHESKFPEKVFREAYISFFKFSILFVFFSVNIIYAASHFLAFA